MEIGCTAVGDEEGQGFLLHCPDAYATPFLAGPMMCTYNDTLYGVRDQPRQVGKQGEAKGGWEAHVPQFLILVSASLPERQI